MTKSWSKRSLSLAAIIVTIFIAMMSLAACGKKYTVTFKGYNGVEIAKVEVKAKDAATAPTAPTVEGYTFKGWDKDFSKVTGNMIVNAKYEKAEVKPGEKTCAEDPTQEKCKETEKTCAEDPTQEKCKETGIPCSTDYTQEKCKDPETFDWEYNRFGFNGKGMTIKFMVATPTEHDPNLTDYVGERRNEKRALQAVIEKAYNIKIVYEIYPSEAAWGPSRVSWIQDQATNKSYKADFFVIDSNWIPTLITNQSIAELYDLRLESGLFKELGYTQDPSYNRMLSSAKVVYGYSAGSVRPDTFLYYNQDLINEYGLDDPATLWNEGKWDYSAFVSLVKKAQSLFDEGMYGFGGDYIKVAEGMIASRGGQFIDSDANLSLLTNQKVIDTYNDLRELYAGGFWETKGTTTVSDEFRAGQVLFQSGDIWFLSSEMRFKGTCDFEISAVPYPTADGDAAVKESFRIPMGYEGTYGLRPVTNGENGISTKNLLNILDDLTRGLQPEPVETTVSLEDAYRAFLMKRIASEQSVNAVMSVQDSKYQYLELLELVSMTAGQGSHYKFDGFWLSGGSLIKSADMDPKVELARLNKVYQTVLDKIVNPDAGN